MMLHWICVKYSFSIIYTHHESYHNFGKLCSQTLFSVLHYYLDYALCWYDWQMTNIYSMMIMSIKTKCYYVIISSHKSMKSYCHLRLWIKYSGSYVSSSPLRQLHLLCCLCCCKRVLCLLIQIITGYLLWRVTDLLSQCLSKMKLTSFL